MSSYTYRLDFKIRIVGPREALAAKSPITELLLLMSQLHIHLINDKTSLFPRILQK